MFVQDQQDGLCEDLAELFGALPETSSVRTERIRWARELKLGLIGYKLDKLLALGMDWRGSSPDIATDAAGPGEI